MDSLTMEVIARFSPAKFALLMCLIFVGAIALAISLIFLIIRAIRKKKLKGSLIAILVSVAMIAAGIFMSFKFFEVYSTVANEQNIMSYSGSTDVISFTSTDKDGNEVDSSVFAGNKVTLVNRWEPWCGPCKYEMPAIEELYQKYRDQGFNVIGVYSDESDLQAALDETGVTYPIIRSTDGFSYLTLSGGVPASAFVDSEGNILTLPEEYRNSSFPDGEVLVSDEYDSKVFVGSREKEELEDMIISLLG